MKTLPAVQVIDILIHAYGKLVFHTIYGLTGDWEESQDLTQDTFELALRALDAARAASGMHFHAKAWLLRIAVNTVRMQQRRRSLMRFIPFSHLREAQQEEDDTDLLVDAMAPVQPAGYGTPDTGDPAAQWWPNGRRSDAPWRGFPRRCVRRCSFLSLVASPPPK